MKRIIVLLFLLVGISARALAQPLVFGIKAGMSFPNQRITVGSERLGDASDEIYGFHVGPTMNILIPFGLEVEANVLLHRRGMTFEVPLIGNFEREMYYLDLPIKLNYAIGLSHTGVFVGIGPTISYCLWGKEGGEDIEWGGGLQGLNRLDVALSAHLGARFVGFQLSVFYDLGLLNLSGYANTQVYNRTFGISLAYNF